MNCLKRRNQGLMPRFLLLSMVMYNALMDENKNISPQDARDRIEKDCVGIWSKRTILDQVYKKILTRIFKFILCK